MKTTELKSNKMTKTIGFGVNRGQDRCPTKSRLTKDSLALLDTKGGDYAIGMALHPKIKQKTHRSGWNWRMMRNAWCHQQADQPGALQGSPPFFHNKDTKMTFGISSHSDSNVAEHIRGRGPFGKDFLQPVVLGSDAGEK